MSASDFEPSLTEQELPREIELARAQSRLDMVRIDAVLVPRFEGHLVALQTAVDALAETHAMIADRSDLDLRRDTRWVAIWEMSGRCLALSNAAIDQVRRGFAAESVGTLRVLHEAANLLTVFSDTTEEKLTRRWLRGKRVEPREAREHMGKTAEGVRRELEAAGLTLGGGDIKNLSSRVYGIYSKAAHNDRKGFAESVGVPARRFAYGPHPDPRIRAIYVEAVGGLVEQVVLTVGHAFSTIFGHGYWISTVKPLLEGIYAIREDMPIGEDVRAAFGYGGRR